MRWRYTFLDVNGSISYSSKMSIVEEAILMHYNSSNKRCKRVKLCEYEGVISTNFKYQSIGIFGGQRFDAEVESKNGKVKLAFIISSQTNQSLRYLVPI